jgi:hypothetical protein
MLLVAFVLVKYKGKNLAPYTRISMHSSITEKTMTREIVEA